MLDLLLQDVHCGIEEGDPLLTWTGAKRHIQPPCHGGPGELVNSSRGGKGAGSALKSRRTGELTPVRSRREEGRAGTGRDCSIMRSGSPEEDFGEAAAVRYETVRRSPWMSGGKGANRRGVDALEHRSLRSTPEDEDPPQSGSDDVCDGVTASLAPDQDRISVDRTRFLKDESRTISISGAILEFTTDDLEDEGNNHSNEGRGVVDGGGGIRRAGIDIAETDVLPSSVGSLQRCAAPWLDPFRSPPPWPLPWFRSCRIANTTNGPTAPLRTTTTATCLQVTQKKSTSTLVLILS